MPIRHAEVEHPARELAVGRNIFITDGDRQSLERGVRREKIIRDAKGETPEPSERLKAMMEIARRTADVEAAV